MPTFLHKGISFNYRDSGGAGVPFFFQHGLGADANQPFSLYVPSARTRLITFDARGHGATRELGDAKDLRFGTFADDLRALMDHLKIERAVVGGISMGSGIALNFTVRFPKRVIALVLSRPAWLDRPHPWNVRMYSLISRLLAEHGPAEGKERFRQTVEYRDTLQRWPEVAKSLAEQFDSPHAKETACKLETIINDTPCADRSLWRAIRVPTLVLAARHDPIHPWEFGEELAREIPGAELREITAKSVSLDQHTRDIQAALDSFLQRHEGSGGG
jgi:pimeloyl-ACP methyl ester carboxylesterase